MTIGTRMGANGGKSFPKAVDFANGHLYNTSLVTGSVSDGFDRKCWNIQFVV